MKHAQLLAQAAIAADPTLAIAPPPTGVEAAAAAASGVEAEEAQPPLDDPHP